MISSTSYISSISHSRDWVIPSLNLSHVNVRLYITYLSIYLSIYIHIYIYLYIYFQPDVGRWFNTHLMTGKPFAPFNPIWKERKRTTQPERTKDPPKAARQKPHLRVTYRHTVSLAIQKTPASWWAKRGEGGWAGQLNWLLSQGKGAAHWLLS